MAVGAFPSALAVLVPRAAAGLRRAHPGVVLAPLGVATVPSMILGTTPPGGRLLAVDEPRPTRCTVLAVTRQDRSAAAAAVVAAPRDVGALLGEEIRRATA